MELVEAVDDDVMIAAFLQAEIDSPRFSTRVLACLRSHGLPRQLVDRPDLTSGVENDSRRTILAETRGYGESRLIFNGFPEGVRWFRAVLDRSEIGKARYLNYDYWVQLSGGTRRVADGAESVRAGREVFRVPNDGFWRAFDALEKGLVFPPPILVCVSDGDLVILEGHVRITAYALAAERCPQQVAAIVGFSDQFAEWDRIDFSG